MRKSLQPSLAALLLLVLIFSTVWLGNQQSSLPEPVAPSHFPHNSPSFSSLAAHKHLLTILSHGPRPFSSQANKDVADFIHNELLTWQRETDQSYSILKLEDSASDGLRFEAPGRLFVERDSKTLENFHFDISGFSPKQNATFSLTSDNIIAKLKGTCELQRGKNCPSLLLSAHYDTVIGTLGVTDDGIAVASIIEIIRTLLHQPPLPHSVIFLLNNGEEAALLGAVHFSNHPLYTSVRATINLEGAGTGGPSMLFRSTDPSMLRGYAAAVARPFAAVLGNDIFKLKLIKSATDYEVYTANGRAAMDVAFFRDRYAYHTKRDEWRPELARSMQHMGEAALGTVLALTRDEEFMRGPRTLAAVESPAVYWHELFHWMVVLPFNVYFILSTLITMWLGTLLVVGYKKARNYVHAHSRVVKNTSVLSQGVRFTAAELSSLFLPILVVLLVEKIRPLATYEQPIMTQILIMTCSVLGAVFPFLVLPDTSNNIGQHSSQQILLNWHISQLALMISWLPITFLLLFSGFHGVGMLHPHALFIAFGLASITVDWAILRPWFGNEFKQGDDVRNVCITTPGWQISMLIAIPIPLLSLVNTRFSLISAMQPTLQDGTPAVAVAGLISFFTFMIPLSLLPYLLFNKTSVKYISNLMVILATISVFLLAVTDKPAFTAHHPLKMRLVSKLDLTNKLAPIDSYAVMFNAVGLQYLTPNYLPNDSCDVVKFRNVPYAKCNIDKLVSEKGVQRYNLPDLHKAIRVTVTPSSNIPNTWTISVTSAYSRICFIETTRGVGREYPFLIWTGKVMPSNFSATDKSAVSFVNNLGDESLFGLQLNTTQIKEQEFRTDSISMQAGCYVDDLQYLPTWRDLETKVLPDWVTLFGTGYAGLTVTSSFNLSESHL